MSSITESTTQAKSTDQLKYEVDAALSRVSGDLTELKEDLTPQKIVDEVIIKDRFQGLRSTVSYLQANPYVLVGGGLAVGALFALMTRRKVY